MSTSFRTFRRLFPRPGTPPSVVASSSNTYLRLSRRSHCSCLAPSTIPTPSSSSGIGAKWQNSRKWRLSPIVHTVRKLSSRSGSKRGHFDSSSSPAHNGNPDDDASIAVSMFNTFREPDKDTINIGKLLVEIEKTGIRRSDARLREFLTNVARLHEHVGEEGTTQENLNVDMDTFKDLVERNAVFLTQVFRKQLVIPDFDGFCGHIEAIYERCRKNKSGKPASYIPQLARYDPDLWACSVCTVDGQRFSLGDVKVNFTLQSCSKPFTYAICLNELGSDVVHNYVSHEPSGRNFNEICLDAQNKPHNPLLNSGAIMTSSMAMNLLKPEMKLAEKFDYMQSYLRRIAGGENIGFNNAVFLSERDSADRNFAMAYFMKEHKCFPRGNSLQETMDLYFQFCSLEVDAEGLSVMGATLANGGICPVTGEKVLEGACVRDVLSLMYSCGMYNYSGQFAFEVGLPAKSGVSGALVLVVPNVMSVALWSPPLDDIGNPVRGLQFSAELVDVFNFHRFDNLRYSVAKLDPRTGAHQRKGLSSITGMFAAKAGDVSALKRHSLQGVDLNQPDYDDRTPLHVAAAEGRTECVRFLVETAGVDTKTRDRWGHSPAEEADRSGHDNLAKYIREQTKKGTEKIE